MGKGQTAKGVELMVAANVFFCLMSALVKYASNIDSYKTTLFRFVVGLGLLGTAALFGKIKLKFVHGHFLFFRGLFGSIAVFIYFLSITKLGIAKATVLICSYPIFAWLVIAPASATQCVIGYLGAVMLVCIGVTAAVGQLLMTEGYRHVTVTTGSLLAMLVPVLNYFVGVIIFNEVISLRSIIGAAIVIGSCAVVLTANDQSRGIVNTSKGI